MREHYKLYLNLLAMLILGLSACAVSTQAQSFPVYVSVGPTIYALSGGNSTVVATLAGANFESLAVGPDNADLDAWGNAVHPFLLYACDTANNAIYRLDPTVAGGTLQQVYSGAIPPTITPNCGRFSRPETCTSPIDPERGFIGSAVPRITARTSRSAAARLALPPCR